MIERKNFPDSIEMIDTGVFPAFRLAAPTPDLAEKSHSCGGLEITIRKSEHRVHTSVEDAKNGLRIDWLLCNNGLPEGKSTLFSALPTEWHCEYRWNHVVASKDRTLPHVSIAPVISRNCWIRTSVLPDMKGFEHTLAQLEPGPCHIAWITKSGGPFPIKSFKDIGAGEDGGIKFRVDQLEYILFRLEDTDLEIAPGPMDTGSGLAILRYENNALQAY